MVVQRGDRTTPRCALRAAVCEPPDDARPGVFWCWLNGNMSRESITRDLEEMKAKGINMADLWDVAAISNPQTIPAGPQFLSDSSVDLIKHALAEGRRLKMRIGIIASSGWNAGGSWVTPDWASKGLYWSTTKVGRPGKDLHRLRFSPVAQRVSDEGFHDSCLLQGNCRSLVPADDSSTIGTVENVIDLSSRLATGRLDWDVPQGKWTIFRFVCSNTGQRSIVPSPNSNSLFVDFFDPEATKRHLKFIMDRLGVTPENSAEVGPGHFEFDSMELAEGIPGLMPSLPFSRRSEATIYRSTFRYLPDGRSKTGQTSSCMISGRPSANS